MENGKGKAITVQNWTGPDGSRKLRIPDLKTFAHKRGNVVSHRCRLYLAPRKYFRC
jgi:hypothetical protein